MVPNEDLNRILHNGYIQAQHNLDYVQNGYVVHLIKKYGLLKTKTELYSYYMGTNSFCAAQL